ncbi:MAG: SIMPL domain-containing protein [Burkholderiales bacterium]|nr:SIMPL domain-containing protein [Burkholderiales bacterium]
MKTTTAFFFALLYATTATAQTMALAPADVPAISLTATATMQVDNDRMTVLMQVAAENASAGDASSEVNTRAAKALALTKGVANVSAKTLNYSTDQVMEKGKRVRWRVTQLLQIETADFAAGASVATRLQDEGLHLASLTFSVSPEARRKAVSQLQHEALVEWQALARQAAASMGYAGYTPGRLAVNAGDSGPRPRFATKAMATMAADSVTVSGGSSEMVVTVSGEALLTSGARRN